MSVSSVLRIIPVIMPPDAAGETGEPSNRQSSIGQLIAVVRLAGSRK